MDLKLDMYNPLDTLKLSKVLTHIQHFQRIYDSSMSDFFVILQFLATASVIKFVETLDFHKEYVF